MSKSGVRSVHRVLQFAVSESGALPPALTPPVTFGVLRSVTERVVGKWNTFWNQVLPAEGREDMNPRSDNSSGTNGIPGIPWKAVIRFLVILVLMLGVLFLAAGSLDWWEG